MANLKKYAFRLGYTLIALFLSLLVIITLYYFNLINQNIYKILKIIILIINIFISGFLLGKQAKSKGYLEGIKLSSMIIILFLGITFLANEPIKLTVIVYYLIILITATFGSMLGMSLKAK